MDKAQISERIRNTRKKREITEWRESILTEIEAKKPFNQTFQNVIETFRRGGRDDNFIAGALSDAIKIDKLITKEDLWIANFKLQLALEFAKKSSLPRWKSIFSLDLARIAMRRGQWGIAYHHIEREISQWSESWTEDSVAGMRYVVVCLYEAAGAGHVDFALPLAQEALKIYERLQHKDLAAARELVERQANQPPP